MGAENWTNGTPTGACDVTIASPGSDAIAMTGGFNMKSLQLGGPLSTPQLVISDQSPNTNLDAQPAGITIAAGASVTLTCLPGGCPGGGPDIYSGASPFANAGTIKVDPNTGGGAVVGGAIVNTGTIAFEQSGSLSGTVVNQGAISVVNGATATNSGASCGDTGASVENDTDGLIDGASTGVLSVRNFVQGDGVTKGVQIPCGSLSYTGDGASEIRATGGFNLTGEMEAGQNLTISAESNNTNAVLQGNFTNEGSITLTCPAFGCNGGPSGGAGFNVNDKDFVNAGTFTVAASSGTGAGIGANQDGTIVNTGTIDFDQSAYLGGPVTNKGALDIADEKVATSSGSSCGDTGSSVKNDSGGSIDGAGSGHLSVYNYEQGSGTTGGSRPVRIPCGSLKYTGTGASTVQVEAPGTPMTGNVAAGQTLRILGGVNNANPMTNAGTIVFDQTASNPSLNAGTVTNTGKIEVVGASGNTASVTGGQLKQTGPGAEVVVPAGSKLNPGAPIALEAGTLRGGGTIVGSVENSGGVVKPGSSPGTLTLNGSYVQGAGGRLEIEIEGTGSGQFDALAVGGTPTLGGTLALIPAGAYPSAATIGDSVAFLTYGGTLAGQFAQTQVSPPLSCGKALATNLDAGAKALKATVVAGGTACPSNGGISNPPPPPPEKAPIPDTKLNLKPKATVKTKQAKAKVKFAFSSPEVKGATFQCKLDKGAYATCSSPKTYKVKPGRHTFSVRAVGPAGVDPSPATAKFKVIRQKP